MMTFQNIGLRLSLACMAATFSFSLTSPVQAQAGASCQADFNKIMVKRQGEINTLNAMTKKLKGKLDPVAACPHLRSLVSAETELLTYMTTNKNWCSISDEVIKNATEGRNKTSGVAQNACTVAAKIKKMQEQGAQAQQNGNAFNAPEQMHMPKGPL
jgi:hypothetical protein